jgi:hypothetical protein
MFSWWKKCRMKSKNIFHVYHIRIIAPTKIWFTRHETDRFLNNHCQECVRAKVILHQFWVKKFFPWKFKLEYASTFTKLFMHVSSRNMFPTIRNLQIRRNYLFLLLILQTSWKSCNNWLDNNFSNQVIIYF